MLIKIFNFANFVSKTSGKKLIYYSISKFERIKEIFKYQKVSNISNIKSLQNNKMKKEKNSVLKKRKELNKKKERNIETYGRAFDISSRYLNDLNIKYLLQPTNSVFDFI
jgi:hypothetical protein